MQEEVSATSVQKIARISGKAGRAEELREALRQLEIATREEPGCIEFTFFQAISNENSFILVERFANQDALQTHMQLPHTQAFFKAQLVDAVHAVNVPSPGQSA